jgi:hypothetical protein
MKANQSSAENNVTTFSVLICAPHAAPRAPSTRPRLLHRRARASNRPPEPYITTWLLWRTDFFSPTSYPVKRLGDSVYVMQRLRYPLYPYGSARYWHAVHQRQMRGGVMVENTRLGIFSVNLPRITQVVVLLIPSGVIWGTGFAIYHKNRVEQHPQN